MLVYAPLLVVAGLALFILRAQLLRVAIREFGADGLHSSQGLGVASGWASLAGAVLLVVLAFVLRGPLWGAVLIGAGLALGVVGSSLFLPLLGQTLAFGHHGGEGDRSIAEFNRRYGHWVAFTVAGIAAVCLYAVMSFRF